MGINTIKWKHYLMKIIIRRKGGTGSGNWGHKGRPGMVGGSSPHILAEATSKAAAGKPPANPTTFSDPLTIFTRPDESICIDKSAAELKHGVVSMLEEMTEIEYDQVNSFIKQWSYSSNDEDYRSLAIQEDAAVEFGIELSTWQKEKLQVIADTRKSVEDAQALYNRSRDIETEAARVRNNIEAKLQDMEIPKTDLDKFASGEYELDELMEKYPSKQPPEYKRYAYLAAKIQGIQKQIFAIEDDINAAAGDRYADTRGDFPMLTRRGEPLLPRNLQRQMLRSMYDATQEYLENLGIKEVILYRGVKSDNPPTAGQAVKIKSNAIESWSTSLDTAQTFGNTVLAMRVPIARILSIPVTGFGCVDEYECVILGNVHDVAYVLQ